MRTPPPFPEAFRIWRGSHAGRSIMGYFLTRRVTRPLSSQKWSGRYTWGNISSCGSSDFGQWLGLCWGMNSTNTPINTPPSTSCVWLVVNLIFKATRTIVLSNWCPHGHCCERFILNNWQDPLPWISIFKDKFHAFSLVSRSNLVTFKLMKWFENNSRVSRVNKLKPATHLNVVLTSLGQDFIHVCKALDGQMAAFCPCGIESS